MNSFSSNWITSTCSKIFAYEEILFPSCICFANMFCTNYLYPLGKLFTSKEGNKQLFSVNKIGFYQDLDGSSKKIICETTAIYIIYATREWKLDLVIVIESGKNFVYCKGKRGDCFFVILEFYRVLTIPGIT